MHDASGQTDYSKSERQQTPKSRLTLSPPTLPTDTLSPSHPAPPPVPFHLTSTLSRLGLLVGPEDIGILVDTLQTQWGSESQRNVTDRRPNLLGDVGEGSPLPLRVRVSETVR